MKIISNVPPRAFRTGRATPIELLDCARIELEPDEQVTFVTPSGAEYDVTRKAWGFYATPSLNGRLRQFGLRAALVRNFVGKYYLFLIESGQEDRCADYLHSEDNVIVRWLDNDEDLNQVVNREGAATGRSNDVHCMCGLDRFSTVHMYFERPAGELSLEGSAGAYRRELFQCGVCRHFVSAHQMETRALYVGEYVDATYGGIDGMRQQFERIASLPPERSDNAGRVRRVVEFANTHLDVREPRALLDIGSGLAVFPDGMKRAGWSVTALDPDARAAEHARDRVGVRAITGDFMTLDDIGVYNVVTFNKVLEHVIDPIQMLARSRTCVKPGGFVYLEVPDGEEAARDPDRFGREEFFIEHHHVFSTASAALLVSRAGFSLLNVERLREPSGKYTLRLIAQPPMI